MADLLIRSRLRKLLLGVEASEGGGVTWDATHAGIPIIEANFRPNITYEEADLLDTSFDPLPQSGGIRLGELSFSTYFKGAGGAVNDDPVVLPAFRGCGYRAVDLANIDYTGATYPGAGSYPSGSRILPGEVIQQQGGGGWTGLVAWVDGNGSATGSLRLIVSSGSITVADVWECPKTGATGTVGAVADPWARALLPDSVGVTDGDASLALALFSIATGNTGLHEEIRGARGEVSLVLELGRRWRLDFRYQGQLYDSGSEQTHAFLSSVTSDRTQGPKFLEATGRFHDKTTEVCFNNLSFRQGRRIANRTCGFATGGIKGTRGTGWSPEASINPELSLPSSGDNAFDWATRLDGEILAELIVQKADVQGNSVFFAGNRAQITTWEDTDDEGIVRRGVTLPLVRESLDAAGDFSHVFATR